MPSQAHDRFEEMIAWVDQLIQIHARLRNGAGRRHKQEALYRAGVVLSIAAWETYVEELLRVCYGVIEADSNAIGGGGLTPIPNWARHAFSLKKIDLGNNLKQFNTPNPNNVAKLMKQWLSFDPTSSWSWTWRRGAWSAGQVSTRLDNWLSIRHGVAHGGGLPTNLNWLHDPRGRARLTLQHLKDCREIVQHVVDRTDAAAASHLQTHFGITHPW